MNWVLIVVLLILPVSAMIGYKKGILRIVYSMAAWVIALVFVSWVTPHINSYLLENTSIHATIEAQCEEKIRLSANEQIEKSGQEKKAELMGYLEKDTGLEKLGISLPDSVVERIFEKTTAAGELLEESGIYAMIASELADFLLKGISFLVALVVTWVFVHVVSSLLGIMSHLPIIKGTNRCLGGAVGLLEGMLVIWLVFYIIALGSMGEMGQTITAYVYESPFLVFLYENNPVLMLMLNAF